MHDKLFLVTYRSMWLKMFKDHRQQYGGYQRRRGGGEEKDKRGQIYGDGGRLDLEWWAHNAIYRWHIIELYTWNLSNVINQCHLNKFCQSSKVNHIQLQAEFCPLWSHSLKEGGEREGKDVSFLFKGRTQKLHIKLCSHPVH